MIHVSFTPRIIGWCLTVLSYILAFLFWSNLNGPAWLHYVTLVGIPICFLAIVFLAIKFKCYDLWAAALFSSTSLLVVVGWAAPYFSAK